MNIAWFTPLSKKSAIARVSVGVVTELAKSAQVQVFYFDSDEVRELGVPAKRLASAAAIDDVALSRFDLAIYNFGNYLPFHREIYKLSRRHPGICILHDFVMHHFFAAYYLEDLRNPPAYSVLMETLYGDVGAAAARHALSGHGARLWETDDVVRFPLYEEVMRGALGVVTHAEFFRRSVEQRFAGPVRRISLPYDADLSTPVVARAELGIRDDQLLAVTVGHVNPNKRIEAVIDALGKVGGGSRNLVYAILGPCSPEYQLTLAEAVKRNRLEGVVRFLGQVPDDVLHAHLTHADICINLRFPATEGASASVIEEMLYGKPVIVSDTGFYSELPAECVIKIPPANERELSEVLVRLIEDPALRQNLGAAARRFAETEFRADRYAKEILDFAWEVRTARPLLSLTDRVAAECGTMGLAGKPEVLDLLARELAGLFGGTK